MPEFGELPAAPAPKIPDWVPEKYHEVAAKGLSPDWYSGVSVEERPKYIKMLEGMYNTKDHLSLSELQGSGDGKTKIPPKDQIDQILGLDGSDKKFPRVWQQAVLRHPGTKLTPDQLKKIQDSTSLEGSIKAEAWANHDQDLNSAPKSVHPAHFSSNTGTAAKLPDAKLAHIFRNSHALDYDPSRNHDNYDTDSLADRVTSEDYAYDTTRSHIENRPEVLRAIANHPSHKIASRVADKAALPDDIFQSFLDRTKDTLEGRPITDEEKSILSKPIEQSDSREYQDKAEELQDKYNKENGRKEILVKRLAQNPKLTAEQTSKLVSHVAEIASSGQLSQDIKNGLIKSPTISAEDQAKLLDPKTFLELASGESHTPSGIKPEVLNTVFPAALQQAAKLGLQDELRQTLRHPGINSQNLELAHDFIKKNNNASGLPVSMAEIVSFATHPNSSPELLKQIWADSADIGSKAKQLGSDKFRVVNGEKQNQAETEARNRQDSIAGALVENKNLPEDLTTQIVKEADIVNANRPALNDSHHKMMVDKAHNNQYHSASNASQALSSVTRHTENPDLIRQLHAFDKKEWDKKGLPEKASGPSRKVASELEDAYKDYQQNPHTPADVISKIHDDFRNTDLMDHPNFPVEKVKQFANMSPGEPPSIHDQWNRDKANSILGEIDPDNYSYKTNGPGETLGSISYDEHKNGIKSPDFGRVEAKPSVVKLRTFRDKILESEPGKGQLSPKQLGPGPFEGGWKPVQEKNGNVSATKIQEHIDSSPSMPFNFSHQEWDGAQKHSRHSQRVFKLNVTTDHINKMKEAGVFGTFKKLSQYSAESRHPVDNGHTVGWVRYEHHQPKLNEGETESEKFDTVESKPHAIHVDEIQTDMGPNTISKLKENPDSAKARGVDVGHLEKINKIVFGDHNPSEVIMEAFRQHHRNQGRADVPIHMLHGSTKAPISGMNEKEQLPAHMNFTYNQLPKKSGFTPSTYGQTEEQDNKSMMGKPTWTDKVRKSEDNNSSETISNLIFKALQDIKVGRTTESIPEAKASKVPEFLKNRNNVHDYNHLLSPNLKRAGYRLFVTHNKGSNIIAGLYHKNQEIGNTTANFNPYDDSKLSIDSATIGDSNEKPKHRGKGLGTAMYEAVLAHAVNHAGIKSVHGSTHSSMAHAVHNKLANKHGLAYQALPNYLDGPRNMQNWETKEAWEKHPSGPFDDKWGGYTYMLKSESKFRSAAFRCPVTNTVFETGTFHDISELPEEHQDAPELLEAGFVTHAGVFLDRKKAAKYAEMPDKFQTGTNENSRTWLDSSDKEAFADKGKQAPDIQTNINKNEDPILSMLDCDDPVERILALKSNQVMPHHLIAAIKDQDPEVRTHAATHGSINEPLMFELLRHCNDTTTGHKLLCHDSASNDHLKFALEHKPEWFDNQ